MLYRIKLVLGLTSSDKDELLLVLIDKAKDFVKNYCHITDTCGLNTVVEDITILYYNRLGTEGLTSESYSGVDFNYTDEYPDHIMNQLKAYRRLRVW